MPSGLRFLLLGMAILFAGPVHAQVAIGYMAIARPDSVVPPLQGEALGYLQLLGESCPSDEPFVVSITYRSLDSDPIGAAIHRGEAGQNGEQVMSLIEGFFTPQTNYPVELTAEICEELSAGTGSLYFIIKTIEHPQGGVRGQIWPEIGSPIVPFTWGRLRSSFHRR